MIRNLERSARAEVELRLKYLSWLRSQDVARDAGRGYSWSRSNIKFKKSAFTSASRAA